LRLRSSTAHRSHRAGLGKTRPERSPDPARTRADLAGSLRRPWHRGVRVSRKSAEVGTTGRHALAPDDTNPQQLGLDGLPLDAASAPGNS